MKNIVPVVVEEDEQGKEEGQEGAEGGGAVEKGKRLAEGKLGGGEVLEDLCEFGEKVGGIGLADGLIWWS